MENTMSRMLIETIVRSYVKNIKEDPDRGIRNLVDMAQHFSKGRFQRDFFSIAQNMLQNENSAYYTLARNAITNIDTERLITFGMNLGYNGCTRGAKCIRANEEKLGCNIPWAIGLQIDSAILDQTAPRYHQLIEEGENLGTFVWSLTDDAKQPINLLPLVTRHPDSAFFLLCEPEDVTPVFLDAIAEVNNLMITVKFDESADGVYSSLRKNGLLYSIWIPYGADDVKTISNGDLFSTVQQFQPLLTFLLAEQDCPVSVQDLVYQTVVQTRYEQTYSTILYEMFGDNRRVDAIISDDACEAFFTSDGTLRQWKNESDLSCYNIFEDSLENIFIKALVKERRKEE